jgi:hypothetical protein
MILSLCCLWQRVTHRFVNPVALEAPTIALSTLTKSFWNDHRDLVRIKWAIVRDVIVVPHQDLESVPPRWQFYPRLGLSTTEVQMVLVRWNLVVKGRQLGIDNGVVMACVGFHDVGRHNANTLRAHPQPQLSPMDDGAVMGPNDIGPRSRRRRRVSCLRRRRTQHQCRDGGRKSPRFSHDFPLFIENLAKSLTQLGSSRTRYFWSVSVELLEESTCGIAFDESIWQQLSYEQMIAFTDILTGWTLGTEVNPKRSA